jgi:hypothetical protein
MVPLPQALALSLCDRVIIEQGTKNPSLIGIFLARKVEEFPSEPVAFSVFVPMMVGRGKGTIELVTIRLESDDQIYAQRGEITFPDRLAVVHVHFRVSTIRFPGPGNYEFLVLVDGDLIAQRRIAIYLREDQS